MFSHNSLKRALIALFHDHLLKFQALFEQLSHCSAFSLGVRVRMVGTFTQCTGIAAIASCTH